MPENAHISDVLSNIQGCMKAIGMSLEYFANDKQDDTKRALIRHTKVLFALQSAMEDIAQGNDLPVGYAEYKNDLVYNEKLNAVMRPVWIFDNIENTAQAVNKKAIEQDDIGASVNASQIAMFAQSVRQKLAAKDLVGKGEPNFYLYNQYRDFVNKLEARDNGIEDRSMPKENLQESAAVADVLKKLWQNSAHVRPEDGDLDKGERQR